MPVLGGPSATTLRPVAATPAPQPDVDAIYVPSSGAWLGVAPGTRTLTAHEADLGRTVDIAHVFKQFTNYDTPGENFPGTTQQGYIDGGRMLLWNWKPGDTTWTAIAAGSQDSRIDATADNIVEWEGGAGAGKKTFMAFHHEPEDDCTENGGTFGTAANYASAWRRVRDRFNARGVTSIIYCWVMTGYKDHTALYNTLWPGDDYIDWIAYDAYTATCPAWNNGNPNDAFLTTIGEDPSQPGIDDTGKHRLYKWATGVGAKDPQDGLTYTKPGAHDKPIMLAEWAPSDDPTTPTGQGVQVFTDWKAAVEANTYPQVKAWVYYESNASSTCTHLINITPATLTAYTAATGLPQLNRPRPY